MRVMCSRGWPGVLREFVLLAEREEARLFTAPRMPKMEDVRFDRQFRTPYSEGFHMMLGTTRVGTVDLHFTSTTVHCTLVMERDLATADLAKLIEQIDEDLVLSADTPRDDLLVSVYRGSEVGFFNDSFRADQEELTLGGGEEEDDEDLDGIQP